MIAWIIFSIILLIIVSIFVLEAITFGRKALTDFETWGMVFVAAIIGLLALFLCAGISYATGTSKVVGVEKTELKTLVTNTQTEGSFFLGSGTVDDERVMEFITKDDEGGWVIKQANVSNVSIYEDENEKPYVERNITQHTSNGFWWFSAEKSEPYVSDEYKFHIPKNSILGDYDVSLSK